MPNASARNARRTARRDADGLPWTPNPGATQEQAERFLQAQSMFYGTQAEGLQKLLPEKLADALSRYPTITPEQVRLYLKNQRSAWQRTLPFMGRPTDGTMVTIHKTVGQGYAVQWTRVGRPTDTTRTKLGRRA